MEDFYTLETIRTLIINLGGAVKYAYPTGFLKSLPDNWLYCPCITIKQCIIRGQKSCARTVGISFNDSINNSIPLVLEIIYIRDGNRGIGVIRKDQRPLQMFLESAGIDRNALQTITIEH
jgi:hypothetical protein